MKPDINKLLDFIEFINEYRRIERLILLEGEGHYENDAEHSFQTAMAAMFIIETNGLKLDVYKCMAMAMVHDIIEVYSGDTPIFSSRKVLESKERREEKAVKTLEQSWPNIPTMHEMVKEYKEAKTPEAKFIYTLDKLMPELNNYIFDGRIWQQIGVNLEQVKSIKVGKMDGNKTIKEYHRQIIELIEQKPELFGAKK